MNTGDKIMAMGPAGLISTLPSMVVSTVSLANLSTPEYKNPVRDIDVLGLPDFFDHAGNTVNGVLAASTVVLTGILLESLIMKKDEHRPVSIAVAGAGMAIGVNVAYEASVPVAGFEKPADAPFDAEDAAYGGAAGLLFSIAYGIAAVRQKNRLLRAEKQ